MVKSISEKNEKEHSSRRSFPGEEFLKRTFRHTSDFSAKQVIALVFVPLIVWGIMYWMSLAKGPFWLGTNLDPDYVYLLNSLCMAEGYQPAHIHHPGTPVQIYGSLVLRLSHMVFGQDTLVRDVLVRPEFYLSIFRLTLMISVWTMLTVIGAFAFWSGVDWSRILVLQCSPILSVAVLYNSLSISPESILLLLEMLFVLVLLMYLRGNETATNVWIWAIIFGALSGMAIAVKFNAATFAVFTLVIIPSWGGHVLSLSRLSQVLSFFGPCLFMINGEHLLNGFICSGHIQVCMVVVHRN